MTNKKLKSNLKEILKIFLIFLMVFGGFRLLVWLFHFLIK